MMHVNINIDNIYSPYSEYRVGQKFGGRKVWRIWRILPNRQTLFAKYLTIQLLLSVF